MSRINKSDLCWKIHTTSFLDEVAKGSGQGIYRIPIIMLKNLLGQVAQRASELNDDEMNGIMAKLALYAVADPYDKTNYNAALTRRLIRRGAEAARKRAHDREKVLQDDRAGGDPVGGADRGSVPGHHPSPYHGGRLVRQNPGAPTDGAGRKASRRRTGRAGE